MPIQLSKDGLVRPAPKWWRKLENVVLILLIPSVTLILQEWGFQDEKLLLRANLLINTGLTTLIKGIGMMILDPDDNYISNLTPADQDRIRNPENIPEKL